MPKFRDVPAKFDFPAAEKAVGDFWDRQGIFDKSLKLREGGPTFVFYEGPPTANGRPHPGHVLTRTIKDLFPRYKTMRGFRVPRKAGWDTHGLPVEIEVEKELGISGKKQIEEFGVEKFVQRCRESVWRYKGDWEKMTRRLGFWLDLENAYVTYHKEYVESVWWALKEIWKKGLLYKGHKIVPYCPRCGTPLSSHEVAQGYKEVVDPSVYVRFRCRDEENTSFLAWTTTPWTLLSNAALAVGAELDYVYVRMASGERLILAAALVEKVLAHEKDFAVEKTVKGRELLNREYVPLFDYAKPKERCHYVVAGDFVSLEDGTGIVHMAPAFGEDDYRVGRAHGLPVIQLVDAGGCLTPETGPFAGKFVKDADKDICRDLNERGLLFRREQYKHNYPFCWRCDSPLIYYARASWYIKTTAVADKMLANNAAINWLPGHIKEGRFGEWLRNNIDWAVSRERYWGTPLNIWVCETCGTQDSVASVAELRSRNSEVPADLDPHKPLIDEYAIKCPQCGGAMYRTSEVVDCWFDAGAMPFAQHGAPHRNPEAFKAAFPADFISEAIDQTRGWFYTLLAISTLLQEKEYPHPFKTCVVLGHVCDEKGFKMSKSKGNYLDPWEIFDANGADAMRWYFYSANAPWVNTRFFKEAVGAAQREFLLKLFNVYSFFTIYANIDGFSPADGVGRFPGFGGSFKGGKLWRPASQRAEIDRWMLSELNLAARGVTDALEAYDVFGAASKLSALAESLSNWYVRRNRDRFWKSGFDQDKADAYWTLYESLATTAGLIAPFTPFLAEELYQNLVRSQWPEAKSPESVHLCDWPAADSSAVDEPLSRRMDLARDVVSLGRAARAGAKIKNRQPLGEAVVVLADAARAEELLALSRLVEEELNVKRLHLEARPEEYVQFEVVPNFKSVGPKFGKLAQKIRGELAKRDGGELRRELRASGKIVVQVEGQAAELLPEDVELRVRAREGFAAADDAQAVVALDARITPELRAECLRQEVVVAIQNARKELNLKYEQRIRTTVAGCPEVVAAVRGDPEYVKEQTLSRELAVNVLDGAKPETVEVRVEAVR
ncbi:MAG TPA: isoleucine--tRNA ligase [Planctomycetota bacterium]|nr:isoleucine--tRNA ligase [Planctomycetota bacterium]